jgi:putative PEP-CTERM system TPR-repeat lipoprotein
MHKPIRKSLLYLAVAQAIGAGIGLPGTTLATGSEQPSVASFAPARDLRSELIELKNAVVQAPNDAELRFKLGALYLRAGDPASAEKELIRARDLGIDDYGLLLTLGEAWIAQGQFRRVFTDDALLAAQGPAQLAALETLQGQSLMAQGRNDEAREHFTEALVQVQGYGPALLAMAESHLADDDAVAAQQAMIRARAAADIDPVELLRVEANLAIATGNFDQAATLYRQALSQRNGDPILLRGLAVSQLRQGQPEQANDTLDQLLALNPNNGDAIALKAQAALHMQDYVTAAQLASAVVGTGNDDTREETLFVAGAASLLSGATQQAREYLARYLARRPDDDNARRLLGEAMLQSGDGDEAYDVLKPLVDSAQNDPPMLLRLALAADRAGAVQEAVGYLERAAELSPDNERLRARLAAVRMGTEERQLGLQQLEEIAAKDDTYALFALNAALNRLSHGELESAMATARRVQAMAPDAAEPRLIQAVALLRAGQLDAAEEAFTEVLARQPDSVTARTGMAEIRLRRGDVEQALARFGELAAENPDDIGTQLNLALAELQAGRRLQAQQKMERILADNPDSTTARVTLANLYIADARPDQALDLLNDAPNPEAPGIALAAARAELVAYRPLDAVPKLEQATAREPTGIMANLSLAEAYERNGQPELALVTIDALLEAAPENPQAQYARLRLLLMNPRLPKAELTQTLTEAAAYIDKYPDDLGSLILRGLALLRIPGQREAGLRTLAQVNDAAGSATTAVMLAGWLINVGRTEEAVGVLDAYVQSHPADNYARVRLARSRLAAGAYGAAADDLLEALERGARHHDLIPLTAWTLAVAGRTDEARPYLRQAEAQGGQELLIRHIQALLLLDAGDERPALQLLQGLVDELEGAASPRLRVDYARALIALGQRQAAQQQLQAVLSAEPNATDRTAAEDLQRGL